jgi:hypothetical protein
MRLARRVAEHFVIPADGRDRRADASPAGVPPPPACAAPPPRTPAAVAVLAPPGDAPALGAVLGLMLARRAHAPVAVVCVWSPAPALARVLWRAPALPAAGRLAAALAARGLDAGGSGRLVFVQLAAQREEAAAQARRASAAAGPAPVVLALAGPRAAAFDALITAQDLVVVAVPADSDPALARLAVAGLERGLICAIPPSRTACALAACGLALLPSARRALAAPVAALP